MELMSKMQPPGVPSPRDAFWVYDFDLNKVTHKIKSPMCLYDENSDHDHDHPRPQLRPFGITYDKEFIYISSHKNIGVSVFTFSVLQ